MYQTLNYMYQPERIEADRDAKYMNDALKKVKAGGRDMMNELLEGIAHLKFLRIGSGSGEHKKT